ncbi:hypothetical protein EDD27_3129 [Nonomuraea polychroma]|uniref:DUF916 domain-containing protein n=1 Tax=Nonomuraea polychroma TaxID=46176 RepID=A0A438M4Y2_9ACTN|nr:DUF916 domain-containing protein [Nonomuraea polychroma]RVX40711.1 hypothetical protein EDD27_3129 [Nonomuraea polychroma]
MTRRSRLFTAISVLALVLHGTGAAPLYADGGIGIRLREATLGRKNDPRAHIYIIDHVNPGTRFSRRLEIRNTSSEPQHVKIYAAAAEIHDDKFMPAADPNANELSSWISLDRPEIVVPPNSRTPVKATISVPESATRGERYGAIWAEVGSTRPGPRKNVQIVNRVGVRVYLDIGPGGDPPSDFSIDHLIPGRTEDGLPVIKATVRNTGERALDLSGKLWLSDGPGGLNAGPFAAQTGTTLALNDTAPVMVVLDARLPNGPWKVTLTLQSGLIKRTVTGTLTFPEQNAFWGLPALLDSPVSPIVIATLIVIAACCVYLFVLPILRMRRRRRLRAARA